MRLHTAAAGIVAALGASAAALGAQQPAAPRAASAASAAAVTTVTLPAALDRVLRDYERAWSAGDEAALAALFAPDGHVLQPGRPPVRGRDGILRAYADNPGGPLALAALDWSASDSTGFIIGVYGARAGEWDGKFILALRRVRGGPWLIAADMDNGSRPPRRPGPPAGGPAAR